jgi:hypothetical protein
MKHPEPAAEPGKTPIQNPNRPLLWLVLAATVLVCAALFRSTERTGRPAAGSAEDLSAKRPVFGNDGWELSQVIPREVLEAVREPGAALRNAAVRLVLEKTVDLEFDDKPMDEVVAEIGRQLGVRIWLDTVTLADEGVVIDQPVTIHLRGISGRSALALILEQAQLIWVIEDEVVKVTTSAKAGEILETRVYDMTDLVDPEDATRPGTNRGISLLNVIMTCVFPDSWDSLSGPGSAMVVPLMDATALSVRQTAACHEQITRLLADLRKCRHTPGEAGNRPILVSADESPAALREAAIRRALETNVSLTVEQQPLNEVVADVARQIDVPLFFDRATLADERVAIDSPVTFSVQGISACAALKLILDPLQLTWLIRHEVLFVTTLARAGEFSDTHVYDIADIVPTYPTKTGSVLYDTISLSNAIATTIQPDSDWGNGPGVIIPFRRGGILALVIPQTPDVHEDVAEFLEALRSVQRRHEGSGRVESR